MNFMRLLPIHIAEPLLSKEMFSEKLTCTQNDFYVRIAAVGSDIPDHLETQDSASLGDESRATGPIKFGVYKS